MTYQQKYNNDNENYTNLVYDNITDYRVSRMGHAAGFST